MAVKPFVTVVRTRFPPSSVFENTIGGGPLGHPKIYLNLVCSCERPQSLDKLLTVLRPYRMHLDLEHAGMYSNCLSVLFTVITPPP